MSNVCEICGKRPARPERTICAECAARQKAKYQAKPKPPKLPKPAELNDELCLICGKPAMMGQFYCPTCYGKVERGEERWR